MSRIAATFEALAASGRKALIPYITSGDPEPDDTVTAPLPASTVPVKTLALVQSASPKIPGAESSVVTARSAGSGVTTELAVPVAVKEAMVAPTGEK